MFVVSSKKCNRKALENKPTPFHENSSAMFDHLPCRYGKFFDLVPAGQEYFKQSASRPGSLWRDRKNKRRLEHANGQPLNYLGITYIIGKLKFNKLIFHIFHGPLAG